MTGSRKIHVGLAALLMVGLLGWSASLSAGEHADAIESKAKLLRGDLWTKMSSDQKTAYLWGACNVVDLEQELMALLPQLKVENFSAKAVEAIGDVTINELRAGVDSFYEANPDKLEDSVIKVIWYAMIKPELKTSVAGLPIE